MKSNRRASVECLRLNRGLADLTKLENVIASPAFVLPLGNRRVRLTPVNGPIRIEVAGIQPEKKTFTRW